MYMFEGFIDNLAQGCIEIPFQKLRKGASTARIEFGAQNMHQYSGFSVSCMRVMALTYKVEHHIPDAFYHELARSRY